MEKQRSTVNWISESTLVFVGSTCIFQCALLLLEKQRTRALSYNICTYLSHLSVSTSLYRITLWTYIRMLLSYMIVLRDVRFCFSLSLRSYRSLRRRRRRCYRRINITNCAHALCICARRDGEHNECVMFQSTPGFDAYHRAGGAIQSTSAIILTKEFVPVDICVCVYVYK